MSEQKTENQVELGDRVKGQIELPKLDVTEYIGRRAKIESVTEHEGQHGYYVKLVSEVIDSVGEGDKAFELRASKVLGLQTDGDGNIGWGEGTKMGIFLKKNNLSHYKDAVGVEIVVQSTTNKEGVSFLTFD